MDESPGPAPFPESDELEAETERILKNSIHPGKVKLELETRDKYPNRDGFIELVDEHNRPIGDLTFQLKKIPDSTRDPPRYQCKVETLLYTKVISSPFLLLGVDVEEEVVYWRHITPSWVDEQELEDQKTKVVHFPEGNILDGGSEEYYQEWREFTQEALKSKRIDHEEYRELKEKSNPALGEARPEFENIHVFLDVYNGLLENEFQLVKQHRYPSTWKVGYANVEFSDDRVGFGLYPIDWGENDVQIKDIDADDFEEIHRKSGAVQATFHGGNPIRNRPEEFARKKIEEEVSKIVNDHGLIHQGSVFLARESIFAFVDEFHDLMDLEQSDEYTLDALKRGFFGHLQIWIDEFLNRFNEIDVRSVFREGYINPSHLQSRIPENTEKEIHERVRERISDGETLGNRYLVGGLDIPPGLFEESIAVLEEEDIPSVNRPYKVQDYSLSEGESAKVWELYSYETTFSNLQTFVDNFPSAYQALVELNFPSISHDLTLFGEATKVILGFETEDDYQNKESSPSLYSYHLKNQDEASTDIELYSMENSIIQRLEDTDFDQAVMINSTEYEIVLKSHGGADFIFQDQPVFHSIYGRLKESLDSYFDHESMMAGWKSF